MNGVVISADFSEYVSSLATACAGITAIWLIGSRANGTAKESSDWDLLVFGDLGTRACLNAHRELHRGDVDCLTLTGGKFQNAWGKQKALKLTELEWEETTETHAQYTERKWSEREGSTGVVSQRMGAVRLWSK
jgi:Polymerase beta, Nucleotidyltransferase